MESHLSSIWWLKGRGLSGSQLTFEPWLRVLLKFLDSYERFHSYTLSCSSFAWQWEWECWSSTHVHLLEGKALFLANYAEKPSYARSPGEITWLQLPLFWFRDTHVLRGFKLRACSLGGISKNPSPSNWFLLLQLYPIPSNSFRLP